MVNNLEKILPFLTFESADDFYYLQILQRKKENPEIGSNSKVIKNYYITSQQYLIERYDEIIKLCEVFNARASIRLNKRSFESVGFKTLENIANSMRNREYKFLKASYDRACGVGHNDKNKKWILDIDEKEVSPIMLAFIDHNIEPKSSKLYEIIPSKSGFHVITKPFNTQEFSKEYSDIEIHKDNPTNLYIP